MNYFEGMIINIIFLLFPLFLYLLYVAYQKNINNPEDTLFLSIALISSLYLIMRYGIIKIGDISLAVLFNIPLLISYIKGKRKTAISISLILVLYNILTLRINPCFAALEYCIYYFIYAIIGKKQLTRDFVIHAFIFIKTIFISMKTFYILPISPYFWPNFGIVLLNMILFYFVAYIVFLLLQKGEKIINLNQSLKDLEKEKVLRISLFKIIHEIKNPIAVCKGYLDMLDFNDEKKIRQYIPIVQKEIQRTLTLMDDYSDYTKIKIDSDIMDLYFLIEDTKMQLETLLAANGIKSDFKIPDEELYIEGDYNRLKQVLINVFKNAIEAKDVKKKMKISLRVKEEEDVVSIIIKDNGLGMDDETLEHVSEMFYTTKQNGTGLGVALSKEIIELHGGTIHYESKLGEETTVTIQLPYSKYNK